MARFLDFIGLVVVIAGLAWVATLMGISQAFVIPGAGVLLAGGVALTARR